MNSRDRANSAVRRQENFRMNRMLTITAILVVLGPLALGQTKNARRTQTETVVDTIRRLDQERIQAQIHADASVLDRIYADDFIGIGPSGTVRTKPQVLADFTSHDLIFQSITTDEVRLRVYENTVVETGRSTMVGQDKGKVVPRDNRFTRVWVRRGGRWRLVANHYSTLIIQPSRD
jgi:ketosteroid isomerase-like protein